MGAPVQNWRPPGRCTTDTCQPPTPPPPPASPELSAGDTMSTCSTEGLRCVALHQSGGLFGSARGGGGASPQFWYATPPPLPALRAHLVAKGQ